MIADDIPPGVAGISAGKQNKNRNLIIWKCYCHGHMDVAQYRGKTYTCAMISCTRWIARDYIHVYCGKVQSNQFVNASSKPGSCGSR